MLNALGGRQQQLVTLLLHNRNGLTVDELAAQLDISRTAVNQHLAALMRDGFVAGGDWQKTGGRPLRAYVLSERGHHLFPKQYSWFSSLMVQSMKDEFGSEATVRYLRKIADRLVNEMNPHSEALTEAQRLKALVDVMNDLAYEAAALPDPACPEDLLIEAKNCVYHDLAREHPEVCQFDLELLRRFMHLEVEQEECMMRGGQSCRFRFLRQAQDRDRSIEAG